MRLHIPTCVAEVILADDTSSMACKVTPEGDTRYPGDSILQRRHMRQRESEERAKEDRMILVDNITD